MRMVITNHFQMFAIHLCISAFSFFLVPGPIPLTSHQELEALQGKIGKLKYEMHQEQSDVGYLSSDRMAIVS